jgi:hypothetical protein
MMLTNYPLNRELVAERQRKRRGYASRAPRAPLGRPPRPTRISAAEGTWVSWLLRHSGRRRGNTGPATA